MDAQAGFALLEVLISAVIVALIVIATFTGFDVTQRATGDERAHAQADALAQQDEDRLRSLQINQISGLNETRTVIYNGTHYSVTSTGEFLADSTESPSCVKEAGSASYVRTTSTVTWPALKSRPPVVETGLITPPIGGELLVQVFDGNGAGVPGMTVQATGPSPSAGVVSAVTGANGCVIFSSLKEGEYSVNTFQTGYVDKDGNSEPPPSKRTASVTTGATTKKTFEFAQAGALKINFVENGNVAVEGDQFLIYNNNMSIPWFRVFGTLGTYARTVTTPATIFPFSSTYSVYAGSCTADAPPAAILAAQASTVAAGATSSINVLVPPIKVEVLSGTSSAERGVAVTNATGTLKDTGINCNTTRTISSTPLGGLPHPNMPFGNYSLCVTARIGVKNRKFTLAVANNLITGTPLTPIYLGAAPEGATCP
ncbi:MAG TPA: hypothetical protein VIC06_01215 [Solirubrobacteraceae bacterium]|jgi:Tfp pilus assembly protein PilV